MADLKKIGLISNALKNYRLDVKVAESKGLAGIKDIGTALEKYRITIKSIESGTSISSKPEAPKPSDIPGIIKITNENCKFKDINDTIDLTQLVQIISKENNELPKDVNSLTGKALQDVKTTNDALFTKAVKALIRILSESVKLEDDPKSVNTTELRIVLTDLQEGKTLTDKDLMDCLKAGLTRWGFKDKTSFAGGYHSKGFFEELVGFAF